MMAPGIFPHGKPRDQQETRGGKPGLRLREIAESHESHGIVGHDSGILEGDQREEEADAGGDAKFQADGNRIDQRGRNGDSESAKNSTPERNTRPSASGQLPPSFGTTVNVKYAF